MENYKLFMTLIAWADACGRIFEAHDYGDYMTVKTQTKDGKTIAFTIDIKEVEKDD